MTSFKILGALVLLSAAASTCAFSTTSQRRLAQDFVPQELSERGLAAIPGASTTILRTTSIVLRLIKPNVPKQHQEGLANVSPTLFGRCMREAARPSYLRGVASVDDVGRLMECHVFAV
jgi:hypothetical protein